MNPQRKSHIEAYTEQLLREHRLLDTTPINVSKLARKLGFIRIEEDFGPGFLGAAISDGFRKVISLNKNQHINRKRFTIAHEICHLLWHSDRTVNIDTVINYRDSKSAEGTDWREIEANRFAAALLMPRKLLFEAIESLSPNGELGDEEIEAVAKKFKVSNQALCIRMKNLGIL